MTRDKKRIFSVFPETSLDTNAVAGDAFGTEPFDRAILYLNISAIAGILTIIMQGSDDGGDTWHTSVFSTAPFAVGQTANRIDAPLPRLARVHVQPFGVSTGTMEASIELVKGSS